MRTFSLVVPFVADDAALARCLRALARQTIDPARVEIVLDGAAADRHRQALAGWRRRGGAVEARGPASGLAESINAGLARAGAEWVTIVDPARAPARDWLARCAQLLDRHDVPTLALLAPDGHAARSRILTAADLADLPPGLAGSCLRRATVAASGLVVDARTRPGFAVCAFVMRYLLAAAGEPVALVPDAGRRPAGEPPPAAWADAATYDEALVHGCLAPLQDAARRLGAVPRWLQLAVLRELAWYYTVDARERAPTMVVGAALAHVFHERVTAIMRHIEVDALAASELEPIDAEVRHALLGYKGAPLHSPVAIAGYDREQELVRVSYFFHGERPEESFLGNGQPVVPAFAKDRACRFFRRSLVHERIAWLPAAGMRTLEVVLQGRNQHLEVGPAAALLPRTAGGRLDLAQARHVLSQAHAGAAPGRLGPRALHARMVKLLAKHPFVRRKFANAWVFVDREEDADDNAEHLYRWVRAHHPHINAWFLLTRRSWHWDRLAREGFRLVPPGLRRQLLLLNSDHVISSHAEHMDGGFSRAHYGDMMNWRYSFLQHGVIKDDVSHWLSKKPFDLFITTSPGEHGSIVDDGTPYTYTDREMRRTGLPRHDRLLARAQALAPSEIATILIMPTWRGSLVDSRAGPVADPVAAFAQSEYARRWGSLLRSAELRDLARRHGRRIVFMPHPNAVPFIAAFAPPPHVEVLTAAEGAVQQAFAATEAFVTDYTSVAFSMAFLRRAVFYYQFDREAFYGGSHNWREGYFDYDRDGFGPVAFAEDALLASLRQFLDGGARLDPVYVERMVRAIPEQDGRACERTFQAILDTRRPRAGRAP